MCVLSWYALVWFVVVVVMLVGVVALLVCVFGVGVVGVFGVVVVVRVGVGGRLVLVGSCGVVTGLFWMLVGFVWELGFCGERLSKRVVSGSFFSFSVMSARVVFR